MVEAVACGAFLPSSCITIWPHVVSRVIVHVAFLARLLSGSLYCFGLWTAGSVEGGQPPGACVADAAADGAAELEGLGAAAVESSSLFCDTRKNVPPMTSTTATTAAMLRASIRARRRAALRSASLACHSS